MQFNMVSLLFLLGAAIGVQAGCQGDDLFCGDCNGKSCKIAATNFKCCGNNLCGGNGGDGTYCGTTKAWVDIDCVDCPSS